MVIIDKLLRSIFMAIDSLAGWAIEKLYSLIVQIANVNVFGDYIYEFMDRVYAFLAVFMLFKLSISVVNYILNPDQLSDKTKGFSKLIQQVIIVIALIIFVPTIFTWAYDLQATILNTNVLYTVITGRKNDNNNINNLKGADKAEAIQKSADQAGNMLKYELLATFIYNDKDEEAKKANDSAIKSDGTLCYELVKTGTNGTTTGYSDAYDCLISNDTINNTSAKHYGLIKTAFTNEYKFLISTLCIGFTVYILLVFCFDVALRTVRLGVLQLIAPIPIISMLDPNSGKSGMFSKWVKDCSKTYLSLFIRLLGLFFAIEIIRGITSNQMVWQGTDVPVKFGFVKIFIILGLLMFAKQLPQFIENLTGFKLDGGGLSLKKKLESIPGSKTLGNLGKKTISGLDAVAHKRDFREGWGKIEGNGFMSKTRKWIDGMTPYSADQRKKSQQALHDLNYKKRLYDEGKNILGTTSKEAGLDYYHDGNGNRHNVRTIGDNIKAKKQWIEGLYSDVDGNAAMSIDKATRTMFEDNFKQALIEQYGGDTAKNREYANVAVAKDRAEREMRRLNALQRQAYDPVSGTFDVTRINGAANLDGDLILSADALEESIEKQRKILETVGEYASKEKDFQAKNVAVDAAVATSKGFEPRSR